MRRTKPLPLLFKTKKVEKEASDMSRNNSTVINENQNQITIIQDEVRTIPFTFILSNKDFKVFDITGATEITARFVAQSGSFLEVTLGGAQIAIVNAVGGSITISLTAANTNLLKIGDRQSFEVVVDLPGSVTRIAQVIGRLNVKPRISC